MASDLARIREAIAAALSAEFGGSMQISPWMLSDPTPPLIHVFPDEIEYHQAMSNGAETWRLQVEAMVAMGTDIGAQKKLDPMLLSAGPGSVKGALEADSTLGGLVSDLTVTSSSGYRTYRMGSAQQEWLGATWSLSVLI